MNRNHPVNVITWCDRSKAFKQGIDCKIWSSRSLRMYAFVSHIDLPRENPKLVMTPLHKLVLNLSCTCHILVPNLSWNFTNLSQTCHVIVMYLSWTSHELVMYLSYMCPKPVMNPHFMLIGWLPITLFRMLNFHQLLHSKVGLITIKVPKAPLHAIPKSFGRPSQSPSWL